MSDSESREMYLKSIFELEVGSRSRSPSPRLPNAWASPPVSATEMMKVLEQNGLVEHTPYKGYALSKEGRLRALSVVRKQRLWGRFLADHLGISPGRKSTISPAPSNTPPIQRSLKPLPNTLIILHLCPHGNPIPASDGSYTRKSSCSAAFRNERSKRISRLSALPSPNPPFAITSQRTPIAPRQPKSRRWSKLPTTDLSP